MADYQDIVARKRANPSIKYDIVCGEETAAAGLYTINTGLDTLRSIVIIPRYAAGSETCFVQLTSVTTPSAVTATVTGDDGNTEEQSIPAYWIAIGYINDNPSP